LGGGLWGGGGLGGGLWDGGGLGGGLEGMQEVAAVGRVHRTGGLPGCVCGAGARAALV
jgi:hypothetical protein